VPADPPPNAGVWFPPPLIYFFGLIAGYLINRAVPLWIISPEPRWLWRVGLAVAAAGVVLAASGVVTFRRAGTSIPPNKPATRIVTTGPYAYTRNPMYTSLALFYFGVALLLDTWWALIFLPVVVVIIDRAVIAREERYLASAFGEQYESYRTRTPRWFW